MQEARTPRGHLHSEAYCLMSYVEEGKQWGEYLWNSRDGVTPFTVTARNGRTLLTHTNWGADVYAPLYVPQVGQRIFVTTTPELARQHAEEMVTQHWNELRTDERLLAFLQETGKVEAGEVGRDAMIAHFVANFLGDGSQPSVVAVDKAMHEAFRRRVTRFEAMADPEPETEIEAGRVTQLGAAQEEVVRALANALAAAHERFVQTYPGTVEVLDEFMGAHNYHKGVVYAVERTLKLKGGEMRRVAVDTFRLAMEKGR